MKLFEKRMNEIKTRELELRSILGSEEVVSADDMTKYEDEIRSLKIESDNIEKRRAFVGDLETGVKVESTEARSVDKKDAVEKRSKEVIAAETRGKDLKEGRSITVGSSTIITAKHTANTINPTFNPVSSLIDRVDNMSLPGGESFEQPYVEAYAGSTGYTVQGDAYEVVETIFKTATMGKTKVTAYQELPEEVNKLSNAPYEAMVVDGINTALRTFLTKEVLIGDGTTGHLTGIFDNGATAIDAGSDITINTIGTTSLDDVIYEYGGIEEVEDDGVLILNKKDLALYAKLRTTDGFKVYSIVRETMNTGTIDGVPYLINSACIATAVATTGQYVMAFGPLSAYKLAIFSDVDVQKSTDFKFSTGIVAHKGSVFMGGNVVKKNGFLRVKKV